jgi:hypothetical protein
MKRLLVIAIAASAVLGCAQVGVRGFESGRGWAEVGQAQSAAQVSAVMYLGASADGKIIVQMPDGTVSIWSR